MKRKSLFVLSVLVTLILTVFVVSTASAATGCFTETNGHWAETFICWIKDNGITSGTAPGIYSPEANVTRAQMAVFLQKVDELAVAQANAADVTNLAAAKAYTDTSLSTGQIQVVMAPTEWNNHPTNPHTFTVSKFFNYTKIFWSGGVAGLDFFMGQPTLPVALHGRKMSLAGTEVCYDAAQDSAFVSDIKVYIYKQSTAPGTETFVTPVSDATDRHTAACVNYTFTPVTLTGEDLVFVQVIGDFTCGLCNQLRLGRVTFVLQSTATPADALSAPQMEMPSTDQPQPAGDPSLELEPPETVSPRP